MTPSEKDVARRLHRLPSICSGDIYAGVPITTPATVAPAAVLVASAASAAATP
jgi:hypothetical protein